MPKTTRSTNGVGVMSLRKKAAFDFACPLSESGIVNESRYRAKTLPAAGAILKPEDAPEQQISIRM